MAHVRRVVHGLLKLGCRRVRACCVQTVRHGQGNRHPSDVQSSHLHEVANPAQAFHVSGGIQTLIARLTPRLQQASSLVLAERLGMHAREASRDGHRIDAVALLPRRLAQLSVCPAPTRRSELTLICFGLASPLFGKVRVNTPCSKLLLAPSASIVRGSVT